MKTPIDKHEFDRLVDKLDLSFLGHDGNHTPDNSLSRDTFGIRATGVVVVSCESRNDVKRYYKYEY